MVTMKELKDLTQLITTSEQNVRGDIKALKNDLRQMASEIKSIKNTTDKAAQKASANEAKIKELTNRLASVNDSQRRRNIGLSCLPEDIALKDLET